jgi:hypothetical protein
MSSDKNVFCEPNPIIIVEPHEIPYAINPFLGNPLQQQIDDLKERVEALEKQLAELTRS